MSSPYESAESELGNLGHDGELDENASGTDRNDDTEYSETNNREGAYEELREESELDEDSDVGEGYSTGQGFETHLGPNGTGNNSDSQVDGLESGEGANPRVGENIADEIEELSGGEDDIKEISGQTDDGSSGFSGLPHGNEELHELGSDSDDDLDDLNSENFEKNNVPGGEHVGEDETLESPIKETVSAALHGSADTENSGELNELPEESSTLDHESSGSEVEEDVQPANDADDVNEDVGGEIQEEIQEEIEDESDNDNENEVDDEIEDDSDLEVLEDYQKGPGSGFVREHSVIDVDSEEDIENLESDEEGENSEEQENSASGNSRALEGSPAKGELSEDENEPSTSNLLGGDEADKSVQELPDSSDMSDDEDIGLNRLKDKKTASLALASGAGSHGAGELFVPADGDLHGSDGESVTSGEDHEELEDRSCVALILDVCGQKYLFDPKLHACPAKKPDLPFFHWEWDELGTVHGFLEMVMSCGSNKASFAGEMVFSIPDLGLRIGQEHPSAEDCDVESIVSAYEQLILNSSSPAHKHKNMVICVSSEKEFADQYGQILQLSRRGKGLEDVVLPKSTGPKEDRDLDDEPLRKRRHVNDSNSGFGFRL